MSPRESRFLWLLGNIRRPFITKRGRNGRRKRHQISNVASLLRTFASHTEHMTSIISMLCLWLSSIVAVPTSLFKLAYQAVMLPPVGLNL